MYAFIEAINAIGGIDIVLEESLTDPTYIIKEEGKWKTLHYDAGFHHLDGLGALRIVRSRHTSSDFARSRRQHKILSALVKKINNKWMQGEGFVTKMTKLLLKYCYTDFSVAEIVKYYFKYRNYDIGESVVLNTDNVLYHTYSNLYYLEENTGVDEGYNKGAWILLPLGGWEIISHYIESIIYGGHTNE